jgi:hypothetical protein
MEDKNQITNLSYEDLVKTSGGGILFNICYILYLNREAIWEATVGQYVEGFRDGYNKATNE